MIHDLGGRSARGDLSDLFGKTRHDLVLDRKDDGDALAEKVQVLKEDQQGQIDDDGQDENGFF